MFGNWARYGHTRCRQQSSADVQGAIRAGCALLHPCTPAPVCALCFCVIQSPVWGLSSHPPQASSRSDIVGGSSISWWPLPAAIMG
jgi:hypothetical protein